MTAGTATEFGTLEAQLVDFASDFTFDRLPPAAIEAASARILDSIGVAMCAWLAPPVRIARRLAQPTAGPLKATVWGSGVETTPEMAGFANGVAVRYLDLNDAWRTRDAHHPSDYIPGILALAEATGASGEDFLAALAVAYEIMCRFTDTVPFNDAGWDQPVTGGLATALACGRLLGLDRDAMRDALALAIVPNLATYQTRAGELSMWKGCAGPNGARNGVFAALLAAEGMTGPYAAFEGIFGIWNQTLGGTAYPVNLPGADHTGSWGIQQTNIKTHPVRDSCQLPIMTAVDLREALAGRGIEKLRIETYASAHKGAVADPELWAPQTRETADHSMLFSVACALLDGKVTPDSFEAARFLDADVLDLIGRTEVVIREDFTAATPGVRNCRIVALAGGAEVEAHRVVTLAEIERGMPFDEVIAKFRTCTARVFTTARQDALIDAVRGLGASRDLRALSRLTIL